MFLPPAADDLAQRVTLRTTGNLAIDRFWRNFVSSKLSRQSVR